MNEALYSKAVAYMLITQDTSCAGLQRNLQVGYDAAQALRERLLAAGIVAAAGQPAGQARQAEPFFIPWVGARYLEAGKRLLILGESHYSDEELDRHATIDLTQQYVDGWNHRFWTNLMQIVRGRAHWEIERGEFWAELAFYNYIQETVGDSPGIAPSDAMFAAAKEPFQTVLERLQPHRILVLSARLWDRLAPEGEAGPALAFGGQVRDTLVYRHAGGTALASWIPHPSRIGWNTWHPLVPALLGMEAQLPDALAL